MRRIEMVDLGSLHEDIGEEIEMAIQRVLGSGRFVGGPEIAAFESAFAEHLLVEHVVAVANGTDALQLALLAAGIERDDEVLVPANTFVATAEAVVAVGGSPRFVDVAPDTGLIDLAGAEEAVSERTRAVVPVHLYGRMVEMGPIMELARRHGLVVIEDAAQAHGASREGRCAGTIGDAGCFSFYPGKNLGALGDAGAVVTNDAEIAGRIRRYRDHGRRGRDEHLVAGFNSRMDSLQAAVLTVKLPHLERWTRARRGVAARYRASLVPFLDWSGGEPETEVHHLFPILVEDRDQLAGALESHGIASGVHYRHAMTTTVAFAGFEGECPVAEERARCQLSLPLHPYLSEDDISRVVDAVCTLSRGGSVSPPQPRRRSAIPAAAGTRGRE
jgi:dTDP-4-amino-4,6-dideoxygalactose transaminase